jgi:nucleosome binding factor SPN SPT16 subunit
LTILLGGIFETLIKEDQKVKINVLKRTNDEEADKALFQSLVSKMSGSKVGIIPKDSFDGKFYNSWKTAFEAAKESFEIMDATTDIAVALSQKDDEEMKLVRMASKVTSSALKNLLVEELESILDEDKSTTHENLAAKVEEYLQNPKLKTRLKLSNDVEVDLIDWCYTPIIQSGEKFDLRPSAVSNSDNLSSDVIVCSLGLRYKSYCANIGRTFLIDPEKSKEKNYKFLVELEDYIISIMKEGVTCKDVYLKAQSYIEQKRPDLKDNFLKMCGFGMGIEFRESTFALNPKNTRPIKSGMIFNLYIGLQGLKEAGKEYALFLSDTVRVTLDGCVMLTDMPREASEISYIFKDGENENLAPEKSVSPIKPRRSAIMPSKTRSEGKDEVSSEQRRMNHQKQLALAKQQEGEARFSGGADRSKEEQQMVFRKFESYKKDTFLPKQTRDLKILIDKKNDSIILPIHGLPVPFHLSTLKNVTKSDEGDFVYLRFNFVTPGQTLGRKENTPFENPNATFIRAISFRSADVYRFTEIFRQINDLKKDLTKRETQQKEMADLVVQDKLIEVKGRRPLRLAEVFPRPALEGKRVHGDFEIHQNGLRFVSPLKADQKIDILFSNVKHLFFQPCDGELIVLIHIHLKNHIMIGKKKTKDVQFYREVVDANFDETGNRKRRYNYGDEDELAAEQEERRRRIQLNKEFKEFAEKIGEAVIIDELFDELEQRIH